MDKRYIYTSLTRISNLREGNFQLGDLPRSDWAPGDYVVAEITEPGNGYYQIELDNGRMMEVMKDDLLIGALGVRHATLEATGDWQLVGPEGRMHVLTGAGLFGKLSSKSFLMPEPIRIQYIGHCMVKGKPARMEDFVLPVPELPYDKPTVLLVGTSMSAGKTTAARILIRQFKAFGLRVVGAKLTGAGRYKDILAFADAGADYIFDFVDVGLPSTIYPTQQYRRALRQLLCRIAATDADVAVVEAGASPLEPYNGEAAVKEIAPQIFLTVLAASDPYAAFGVMKSFGIVPDLVTGPATNTTAGAELAEKLCGVTAINIIDPATRPTLRLLMNEKLSLHEV